MSQLNIAKGIACDMEATIVCKTNGRMKAIACDVDVSRARADANSNKCACNGSRPRACGTVGAHGSASTAPKANVGCDSGAPL